MMRLSNLVRRGGGWCGFVVVSERREDGPVNEKTPAEQPPVLLTWDDEVPALAIVTLNRPQRLNAFTVAMHEHLAAILDDVESRPARALVITGSGRGFCAGQDLSDRAVKPGAELPDLGESLEKRYNPLIKRLVRAAFPVIAAVNGVAAGAGANLALACDIVLAARSAKFIELFCNLGLVPDSGGSWHLPRHIGLARALGLALTGEPLSAEKAESWGLIWRAVDDDELMDTALGLGRKLAQGPTAGYAKIKQAIRTACEQGLAAQLDLERDLQRAAGRSADYREGVAAFLEKRPPRFTGR